MPIFDVEIVSRPGEAAAPGLAASIADALGAVMEAGPGKVWVRLRVLAPGDYAENQVGDERPAPVFVTLTASAPPEGERLERLAREVSEKVGALSGRPPENVHLLVQPAAKGRVAFGGRLMR